MTIFTAETYIVKPDKLSEHTAWLKKWEKWMKKHLPEYKEVKSYKVFGHMLGGRWGGYVFMTEFENLADLEKVFNRMMKSDFMTTLYPEFASLIVAGSYSMDVWNPVS
jgi:hypothetical protein